MKRIAILGLSCLLMFSGCSAETADMLKPIFQLPGIKEDEDYKKYISLISNGELDTEGCYPIPVENSEYQEVPGGKVRVTFGENRSLSIAYSTDKQEKNPIAVSSCWLNPGESIYAKLKDASNPLYSLSEFRIREYDADGNILREEICSAKNSDEPLLTIPETYPEGGYSILPVGQYETGTVYTEVYYTDSEGNICPLNSTGSWQMNGNSLSSTEVKVSSVTQPALTYSFNNENYFFVSSDPQMPDPESISDIVIFLPAAFTGDSLHFSVELHSYIPLELTFDESAVITVNSGNKQTIDKNKTWSKKLRYGDQITIVTAGHCKTINCDPHYFTASKSPADGAMQYQLIVSAQGGGNIEEIFGSGTELISVRNVTLDSSMDHASCTFELDGKPVSGRMELSSDQKLTLTCKITEDGWSFAEKSEGIGGFFHDLILSKERTITITISDLGNDSVVHASDYFNLVKEA